MRKLLSLLLLALCFTVSAQTAAQTSMSHEGPAALELKRLVAANPEVKRLLIASIERARQVNPDPVTNPAQSLEQYYGFVASAERALPGNLLKPKAGCDSVPAHGSENVSGFWKGTIESTDKRGHKWQGPAELTLNQNGDALTGTFAFTPPKADRVQVPISSGVVSKDSVTFSGENKYQMASIELTFHGKVTGTNLNGTADMTSRSIILGPATETAALRLSRQ